MILCPVVFGPTASGKSAAAIALAQRYDGVVINADSMQIYRDLRVLTARPSAEEEAQAPHRLYGILDGAETCSAADWRERALKEITEAAEAGKVPILCGGTGFYIKALTEGLSPMPEIPEETRRAVRERVDAAPGADAWEELQRIDPQAADRIEPMDRQRIARALEVHEVTGRTLSDWQAEPLSGAPEGVRFVKTVLHPPRDILVERCDRRLDQMVELGAVAEVEALIARALPADRPILRAVGVPEFTGYLKGDWTLEEAISRAKTATRRYAKRQATWLKTQFISDFYISAQFSERSMGDFFAFIEENGLIRS